MFIEQAVRQFEIWTGENAPRALMEKAALEALEQKCMKITRRKLGMAVLAPAALAGASCRPRFRPTPEEELAAVAEQNKLNAQALDKFRVPMALEPAFQFKA